MSQRKAKARHKRLIQQTVDRLIKNWATMRCAPCGAWVADVGGRPCVFLPPGRPNEPYGYVLCTACREQPDQEALFLAVERALAEVMTDPTLASFRLEPPLSVIPGGKR